MNCIQDFFLLFQFLLIPTSTSTFFFISLSFLRMPLKSVKPYSAQMRSQSFLSAPARIFSISSSLGGFFSLFSTLLHQIITAFRFSRKTCSLFHLAGIYQNVCLVKQMVESNTCAALLIMLLLHVCQNGNRQNMAGDVV